MRIKALFVGLIEERKDIALNEMGELSVRISRSALRAWLARHDWTFKKVRIWHWGISVPKS